MKKQEIIAKATKLGLKVRKHSPEILMVAGVIGTVASAVMACVATTKVNDILDETKEVVDKIHEINKDYTVKDFNPKKELAVAYGNCSIKIAKLYAPAVVLGTLSLSSIIGSNYILKKRNLAIAAAYATLDTSYKEYRNRVVERFGTDVDEELRFNIKPEKVETTVTDLDTGKEKKVKNTVNVADPTLNPYCMYFDQETSEIFDGNNMDYNLMNLRATQQFANDKLHQQGFIFLNDIFDDLGMKKTPMGQKVGWIYKKNRNGEEQGDNYVDFRYRQVTRKTEDDEYEQSILLDFNVDGVIIDQI